MLVRPYLSKTSLACIAFIASAVLPTIPNVWAASSTGSSSAGSQNPPHYQSDAQFYSELSALNSKIKSNPKLLSGIKQAKPLSDEFVKAHPQQFREEVLSLNKSALKKAVVDDLRAFQTGPKELALLIAHDKALGIHKASYTYTFPDGSTITTKSSLTKLTAKLTNLHTDTSGEPVHTGPWTQAVIHYTNSAGYGTFTAVNTVEISTSISSAAVEGDYTFTREGNIISNTSMTGPQGVAHGFVTTDGQVIHTDHYPTASGTTTSWTQGYAEQPFKATATLVLIGDSLSANVSENMAFHEFAVTEVAEDGTVDYYIADNVPPSS